jgi:tartrate/fumarate subfamily iron-sulfur-dependent hydro-lyase beta chain
MITRTLKIPLKEEDVRALEIGDVVYLNGPVYTAMSKFHMRAVEENILPPIDFTKLNVLIHAGPFVRKADDKWIPIGIDLTSSLYMDKYGPVLVESLGVMAIVGKTTMGNETMAMMKKTGCVHLTLIGIMGNLFASQIEKVVDVFGLDELGGAEATWVMEAKNAGPFMVDIDTHGKNLIDKRNREVEAKVEEIYEKYGIKDFKYICVTA